MSFSQFDKPATMSAPEEGVESARAKLAREADLLAGGLATGVRQAGAHSIENPAETASKFAVAALLGAALAIAQRNSGVLRLGGEIASAALAYSLANDGFQRAAVTFAAARDSWLTADNFADNQKQVAAALGPFTLDFLITASGGGLGAGTAHFASKSSLLPLPIEHPRESFHQPGLAAPVFAESESTALALIPKSADVTGRQLSLLPRAADTPPGQLALLPKPVEAAKGVKESLPLHDLNTIETAGDPAALKLYWDTWPAIVRIKAFRSRGQSIGTGFLIGQEGHVATAFHVIADASRFEIYRSDGSSYRAQLDAVNPGADLAIIKLDNTRFRTNPETGRSQRYQEKMDTLPLSSEDAPLTGQKIFSFGYNSSLTDLGVATGPVLKVTEHTLTVRNMPAPLHRSQVWINSRMLTKPGFSGGPVLNELGEVVGVHFASDSQGSSYAIPVSALKDLLASRDARLTPEFWKGIVPSLDAAHRSPQPSDGGFTADLSELYANGRRSVFKLKAIAGNEVRMGTGLMLSEQGHVVTSSKLVEGASRVELNDNGIWTHNLAISKVIPEEQIAILRPDYWSSRSRALSLPALGTADTKVTPGQKLIALGYPENLFELHSSVGTFDGYSQLSNSQLAGRTAGRKSSLQVARLDMPTTAGFEGAPLLNRKGQLVGIATGAAADGQTMTSLPVRRLLAILSASGVKGF